MCLWLKQGEEGVLPAGRERGEGGDGSAHGELEEVNMALWFPAKSPVVCLDVNTEQTA